MPSRSWSIWDWFEGPVSVGPCVGDGGGDMLSPWRRGGSGSWDGTRVCSPVFAGAGPGSLKTVFSARQGVCRAGGNGAGCLPFLFSEAASSSAL
jgi:hypothetical protein